MGPVRSLTFLAGAPGDLAEARAPGDRGAGPLTGGRQCRRAQARASGG